MLSRLMFVCNKISKSRVFIIYIHKLNSEYIGKINTENSIIIKQIVFSIYEFNTYQQLRNINHMYQQQYNMYIVYCIVSISNIIVKNIHTP